MNDTIPAPACPREQTLQLVFARQLTLQQAIDRDNAAESQARRPVSKVVAGSFS